MDSDDIIVETKSGNPVPGANPASGASDQCIKQWQVQKVGGTIHLDTSKIILLTNGLF